MFVLQAVQLVVGKVLLDIYTDIKPKTVYYSVYYS